jgi:hypothetical protein
MIKVFAAAVVIFFITLNAIAGISIEIIPSRPVVNEAYQILFKCNVEGREEPDISFQSENIEIIHKQIQGMSTRTIYQAGKITVSREMLVSFTVRSKQAGIAKLTSIRANVGGKMITREDQEIFIGEIADKNDRSSGGAVFLEAEVSKREIYKGEGITVRYYLYRRVGLQAYDIKKYPKLDGFMKRYLAENDQPQRVTVAGEIFTRSPIYAARLYPEKEGEFEIDGMELSVTHSRDMFGGQGFGFGLGLSNRDAVTRNLISPAVSIKVKPLPKEGMPKDYTGLVGKHVFELNVNRTNILVNEPIEIKASLEGPGMLEAFEPKLEFSQDILEKFDSKSDLNLVGPERAIKTFSMTLLGKNNGVVPASEYFFNYFNPENGRYEVTKFSIPEIRVAGMAQKMEQPEVGPSENSTAVLTSKNIVLVKGNSFSAELFLIITFLIFIPISIYLIKGEVIWFLPKHDVTSLYRAVSGRKYDVKDLYRLVLMLDKCSSQTPREVMLNSSLSADAKEYFNNLFNQLDAKALDSKDTALPAIDRKHLKQIYKTIKASNEDS